MEGRAVFCGDLDAAVQGELRRGLGPRALFPGSAAGLRRARAESAASVPWAWAVNGGASVLGRDDIGVTCRVSIDAKTADLPRSLLKNLDRQSMLAKRRCDTRIPIQHRLRVVLQDHL